LGRAFLRGGLRLLPLVFKAMVVALPWYFSPAAYREN
jgi:hypothetical protein